MLVGWVEIRSVRVVFAAMSERAKRGDQDGEAAAGERDADRKAPLVLTSINTFYFAAVPIVRSTSEPAASLTTWC